MGVPGWPVLDAEGSSTAVGGPGSWDFGKRWVDFLDAGGETVTWILLQRGQHCFGQNMEAAIR